MAGPVQIDPAVIDRRIRYVGPVTGSELPERGMTIAGISGKADARILSKDPGGPATRLLDLPAGWGAAAPGAFTADVELFVLEGDVSIDGELAGPHALVRMAAGEQVAQLNTDEGARMLMFTGAAVRFEVGDFPGAPEVRRFQDLAWIDERAGMLSKTVVGPRTTSRLVMAGHVSGMEWSCYAGWSERYVMAGEWRESGGPDDDSAEPTVMPAGTYVCRAAGVPFDGPGAGTETTAVLLERVVGAADPNPGRVGQDPP